MNVLDLKMEGRSGCKLTIEDKGNRAIIKKYSSSVQYNHRLLKQAEKQNQFYFNQTNSAFLTPEIIEINDDENGIAWFSMNYVFADKYSDYLDQITIRQLKNLLKVFIQYLDESFERSENKNLNHNIFTNKFDQVSLNIIDNPYVQPSFFLTVIKQLEKTIPNKPLPIGNCHGDFTFSNILFGESEIFLLDFLDSFIESPMIDIVKLRQDTCYKWSIMLENKMPRYKINKLYQVFDYFDNELEQYCKQLQLQDWYIFLQAVNLLRIVPYLKDQSEILFIENALKRLLA